MKFNDCPLRNELKEGLLQYERDSNISPHSLVESLIEDFLYKNGYLIVGAGDKEVPFPTTLNKPRLPNTSEKSPKKWYFQKWIGKNMITYGSFSNEQYEDAKKVHEFLERNNWDTKYSRKTTGLTNDELFEFLLNEAEKEKNYD